MALVAYTIGLFQYYTDKDLLDFGSGEAEYQHEPFLSVTFDRLWRWDEQYHLACYVREYLAV